MDPLPLPLPPLLAGYRPLAGVADELLTPDGSVRPVWAGLLAHLSTLRPEDLGHRFARGDQYLRDQGVYLRHYGESGPAEREWPLSHVPVLIEESDWSDITRGLIQRANRQIFEQPLGI